MQASRFQKGKYMDEKSICSEIEECPICLSKNRRIIGEIQKNPEIFLKYCNNCFAVSASRLPTINTLEHYYTNYYQSTEQNITFDDPERLINHLFIRLKEQFQIKDTIKILDFGGGCGTISIELGKKYLKSDLIKIVKIFIVDINQSEIKNDSPKIIIEKHHALSDIINEKFDIIIASAIIEHLPYPGIELKQLFDLLNEGGQIYFRTPYIVPILLLLKKIGITIDITFPGHIHDLGQEFWENILKTFKIKSDFKIISSKPSIVETTFSKHFWRTLIAYLIKSPWYFLPNNWKMVGGWDIFIQRRESPEYQDNTEKSL